MTTLDRPLTINTKARRVGKLEKPAPLKRSLSSNTGSEEKLNCNNVPNSAITKTSAENLCANMTETDCADTGTEKALSGLSSRRLSQRKNLKLVKPRPLKKKSDDVSPTEAIETHPVEKVGDGGMSHIPSGTSDTDLAQLLKMSRDSGIEDMEKFERRTSQLSSVGEDEVFSPELANYNRNSSSSGSLENQTIDDLDWNDLDEPSEPFIFGHSQLKYTSFAVNQAIPFNSFVDSNEKLPSTPGRGRGRGRGRGYSRNPVRNNVQAQKQQFMRSQSVPLGKSEYDDVENWDPEINSDEIDNPVPYIDETKLNLNLKNETKSTETSNSNSRSSNNTHVFSEDWEGDLIDTSVEVENDVQHCIHETINSKDSQDSFQKRLDGNTSDKENICERNRMCTPEPEVNCDKGLSDLETTPKVSDSLAILTCVQFENNSSMICRDGYVSNYSPYFPPVQKPMMTASSYCQGQNSQSSTRSTTPVNANPEDCIITPVKDPWEASFKCDVNGNSLNVSAYRSKCLEYDTCSSDSKSKASDIDSVVTSDDGFIEQEHAWELVKEVTDKLKDVMLDTGSSNRSSFAESETNAIPVDKNEVGNVSEVCDREHKVNMDFEVDEERKWIPAGGLRLTVIRNPLTPSSMLQEIWDVEQTMPGGMYSPKGRRKMFRNYAICRELETVIDETTMIQYSIDELLTMGASPLCRHAPETWSYLTAIHPDICLKEVTKFFDVEKYREERQYVVENFLVKDISSNKGHSTRLCSLTESSNKQSSGKPAGFQGFGRSISMPTGTGDQEMSLVTENQTEFGTQHHDYGKCKQQDARPKGFGIPPQKQQDATNSFGLPNLDTKCDISVKSNGLAKVFSENGNMNTVHFNLDSNQTGSHGVGKKFTQKPRNYSELLTNVSDRCNSSEEEFYCNRDLPEHCPW